ncbi:MAG: hypothetical protein ACI89X_004710, partial [Planctomycetota bacterium]
MHISSRRQLARRLFGAASTPAEAPRSAVVQPPPSLERQMLARATFGSNRDVANDMRTMGPDVWLEEQLHPDSISDVGVEHMVATAIEPWEDNAADLRMLIRAMYSRRQLAWRMVYFLNRHFSTYGARTQGISETKEDDGFYARCFGSFENVLRMSATSPAMIDFLDLGSNVAGNPNENYARELLELHTISIDGGYTEADVAKVARVFTGWGRTNVGGGVGNPVTNSYFTFNAVNHDAGPKTLSLGWSTPGLAGFHGRREGVELLRFLAGSTRTAIFFTKKLCLYFVGDEPPAALQSRVRQAFQASGGSLRDTVRALFMDPDFATASAGRNKTHDGFEFVVNVLRRFYKGDVSPAEIRTRIAALRSLPHGSPSPKGYPEVGSAWHGPGTLLPRWQFADDSAH